MTDLNYLTFATFVASNRLAVVHFWASWNGYDTQMKAILTELAPQVPTIAFAAIDTDPVEHHALCASLGVRSLPYIAIFKDGSHIGMDTKPGKFENLVQDFKEALQHLS